MNGKAFFQLALSVLLGAASLASVAVAHAETKNSTYSVHMCRFQQFSDLTTCPAAGFCARPKLYTANDNIFTLDSAKLQPRTESAAGMPVSFLCPINHSMTSASSVAAEVAGGAASDTPLSCTLYSVGSSGLVTGSSTGTVTGTTDEVLKSLKVNGVGGADSYVIKCQLPVPKPVLVSRTNWIASASDTGGTDVPARALDGSMSTRWTTGKALANGQWFAVDMRTSQPIYRLVMDSTGNNSDYARAFVVETSDNGTTWTPRFTDTGAGPLLTVDFSYVTARYLRVRQTGSSTSWWSIREFNVYTRAATNTGSTLHGYRAQEDGTSSTANFYTTFPATVCTAKNKNLSSKLRYTHTGATNTDTANMVVECPIANPDLGGTSRTTSVALHENKTGGGSTCREVARYAAYDGNSAGANLSATTSSAGNIAFGFVDATDYQEYIRFSIECTLTPGSTIRQVSHSYP